MSGEIDRTPNPSYPKMVRRNECVACGHLADTFGRNNDHVPEQEHRKIRLYQGLPLCWKCAYKITMRFQALEKQECWRMMPGDALHLCDTIKPDDVQESIFRRLSHMAENLQIVDTKRYDVKLRMIDLPLVMSECLREKFIKWTNEQLNKSPESEFLCKLRRRGYNVIEPVDYSYLLNQNPVADFIDPIKKIASIEQIWLDTDPACHNDTCTIVSSYTPVADAIFSTNMINRAILKPYVLVDGDGNIVNLLGFVIELKEDECDNEAENSDPIEEDDDNADD